MAKKSTHTHRAHCQGCGAVQAVDNTTKMLAKHGYTVEHNYFQGVCAGAGYAPVELSRARLDWFRTFCIETAERMDQHVVALKDGSRQPAEILKLDEQGRSVRVIKPGFENKRSWEKQYQNVPVAFADATAKEIARAVELEVFECERNARHHRDHEKFLVKLAADFHGKPLLPVEVKPVLKAGDLVTIASWGLKDDKVEAIVERAVGFRGRYERHAEIVRKADGKTVHVPIRSIREFKQS